MQKQIVEVKARMMTSTIAHVCLKSRVLSVFAGLVMAAFLLQGASAHEVRPAISNVKIEPDAVEIDIRLSLEALVARIDLETVKNTDDAPNAAAYDELRALSPVDLEAKLRMAWPELVKSFRLSLGEQPLRPVLERVKIPEIGDVSLPRDTTIFLTATLPASNSSPVTFGWAKQNGPLIVRQVGGGEDVYTGYLTGGKLSAPMPRVGIAQETALSVFARYIAIGFEHIIPKGLDHILFVLGLFFFSLKFRPLLIQITAFTLAHTVTLALAVLGLVSISPTIVEPLIAASIVYVAVENVLRPKIGVWRTAIVFVFGLLHGLGFASVLGEVGLAKAQLALGLIGFNVGVEFGQLAVVAGAFLLLGLTFGRKTWYRKSIAVPCSVLIALVGGYWFFERILA